MNKQPPSNDYERLRSWTLISLYGSMSLLCLMLLYALAILQASFTDRAIEFYGTTAITVIAAIYNGNACWAYYKCTRAGKPLPRLALKPFLFMAITLLFAGRLLSGL